MLAGLDSALRLNQPGFFHTHVWFAAVDGQLGNRDEAAQALAVEIKVHRWDSEPYCPRTPRGPCQTADK